MKIPARLPTIPIHFRGSGLFEGWIPKAALALFLVWELWTRLGPRTPDLAAPLRTAADSRVAVAVNDLAAKLTARRAGRVVVLPLGRDDTNYVTTSLRTGLAGKGVGQQMDASLGEKIDDLLNLSRPVFTEAAPAVAEGKRLGADAVVFGSVQLAGSDLGLDLNVADTQSSAVERVRTVIAKSATAAGQPATAVDQSTQWASTRAGTLLRRIITWAVLATLLPVFTIEAVKLAVRRRTNSANAAALAVYVVVDAAVLFLLLPPLSAVWLSVMLLAGAAAATWYTVAMMSWVVRRQAEV